jgi:spore germination protein YaaH
MILSKKITRGVRLAPIFVLTFFIAAFQATSSLAEIEYDPYLRIAPIDRRTSPDTTNRTPHFALIREHADSRMPPDVWVPSELLTQMNVPIKLNSSKTSYTLRVVKPSETLDIPALASLSPNAIDLEFRAKSEDNRQYFNLGGMEKTTGLAYSFAPGDVLIVGAASLMSPYVQTQNAATDLPDLPKPFNLVWDHVMADNADLSAEEVLPTVGVISPTWFALLDETGRTSNRADASYVACAHAKGYRVWGLVSNGFNKDRTRKFLANKTAQDVFISSMLSYARIYGLDGINIDFENVDNDDASRLTEFVRRFASAGRTLGLTFSMDVTIPTKWSRCFQRRALSGIVDYIAVMTYDEHWRTSPKSGSTASLPWVNAAVNNTLAEVHPDKLLMGVPFYTREWQETSAKNGKVSVKSIALSMASVDERIASTGAQKRWLEATGQNYLEYSSDGKKYRIWVEDESSIALRMALVKRYALAGAAFWKKGFEKPEIWRVVEGTSN